MTFADDIENAAKEEPIEAIIIYEFSKWYGEPDPRFEPANAIADKTVTWDIAKPLLSYDYNDGSGNQDCHDIIAWTPNLVLYIHEYDGSTSVESVPRNPPCPRK